MAKKIIGFNVANEQVILATMFHNIKVRKRLTKELKEENFIGSKHKVIFNALCKIAKKNLEYNEDTLASEADGEFGGFKYLRKLYDNYEDNPNIDHHVQTLLVDSAKFQLRKKQLTELENVIEDPSTNVEDLLSIIDDFKKEVNKYISFNDILSGKELEQIYLNDLKERSKYGVFVPTHLSPLDDYLTEGMARKRVSVITARPSMGKTTFAKTVSINQSRNGIKVLMCPIEGGSMSFIDAAVADYTEITLEKLIKQTNQLSNKEKKKIAKAVRTLVSNNLLHTIENPSITLDKIGAILDNNNYSICYIDLFERLKDVKIKSEHLSESLRTVQTIAAETNCHISLLHQLRRFGDKKNKRPDLEQLKNSGAYEEIADLVLGLYRPKYYKPSLNKDILEVHILKQRRGELGRIVAFDFDGKYAKVGKGYRNYVPTDDPDEDMIDMDEF